MCIKDDRYRLDKSELNSMIIVEFALDYHKFAEGFNTTRVQTGAIRHYGEFFQPKLCGIPSTLYWKAAQFETLQTMRAAGVLYLDEHHQEGARPSLEKINNEVVHYTTMMLEEASEGPLPCEDPTRPMIKGPHIHEYLCNAFRAYYDDLRGDRSRDPSTDLEILDIGEDEPLEPSNWFAGASAPPSTSSMGAGSFPSGSIRQRPIASRTNPLAPTEEQQEERADRESIVTIGASSVSSASTQGYKVIKKMKS